MSNYQEPLLVDLEDQVGCGFLCITGGDSSGGPVIGTGGTPGGTPGGGGTPGDPGIDPGGGGSDPSVTNAV